LLKKKVWSLFCRTPTANIACALFETKKEVTPVEGSGNAEVEKRSSGGGGGKKEKGGRSRGNIEWGKEKGERGKRKWGRENGECAITQLELLPKGEALI
jgi:hypothetical protein